jgi:hypothetical protein
MTNTTEQLPTVEGKVEGIVGVDPLILQCRACGATTTQPDGQRVGPFIILSGYHFHTCEGRTGIRRCPSCLAAVVAECPSTRCKQ